MHFLFSDSNCAKFFEESSTDTQIISELDSLELNNSACIGGFYNGIYDGIFKYDEAKKLLAFVFKKKGTEYSKASVYIRHKENILTAEEQLASETILPAYGPRQSAAESHRVSAKSRF